MLLLAAAACNKPAKNNAAAVKTLHNLLDQNEYFKLDAKFKALGSDIEEKDRLYFKSYIDNAFNRNTECIKDIDSLLNDHGKELPDSTKAALKHLQGDSYFKVFEYAKAADCDNEILKNYKKALHKDFIDDISNDLLMRNALKEIPAQQTIKKTNSTISWKRDAIGLVEIPVVSGAKTFDGIFDTRANISSITQTYAKKLGLHILNVSFNEGSGATGITFKTGMGIADSLYIGDILVKNVVFQVMPDSILYIAPIKFQLNIIIGFPVIGQMLEVHVYKNGKMMIPETPAKSDLHNFALDGLDPVIELKAGNDTLAFHFDSGAVSSTFYQSYFNKYKATVLKTATKKMVGFGGAGGTQKKEVYILPKVNLALSDQTATVDSISVLTKPISPGEKFYGNIGQDFTNKFNEVIYNFKDMYVKGL